MFRQPLLLARAAVRGSFDPLALLDRNSPTFEADTAYLAERSTETRVGERWLWTLNSAARLEGLAKLPADAGERAKLLKANLPEASDALGRMLHRALVVGGSAVPADLSAKLSVDEQVALFQVIEALLGAGIPVPEGVSEETARCIKRSIAVRERDKAARIVVQQKFRGRLRERKLLSDFAERGGEAIEALRGRKVSGVTLNDVPAFRDAIPALAITGIGGIGKSALLTTIAGTLAKRPDATVLVFDFDRPDLRAGVTAALTMELSRQLALLIPVCTARGRMLEALDRRIASHLDAIEPWDRSYALARSVVALEHLSQIISEKRTERRRFRGRSSRRSERDKDAGKVAPGSSQ